MDIHVFTACIINTSLVFQTLYLQLVKWS